MILWKIIYLLRKMIILENKLNSNNDFNNEDKNKNENNIEMKQI